MSAHQSCRIGTARWEALGTTAIVRVDDATRLHDAEENVRAELSRIDLAASRFRSDSELERINAAGGTFTRISPLLHEAIAVALRAAERTGGVVDPTLGRELRLAGYVRDWRELEQPPGGRTGPPGDGNAAHPPRGVVQVRAMSGWQQVELGADPPRVRLPAGMQLDLGATAKALAADRAAAQVAAGAGGGALVALGGDIAVAGRVPDGGWLIHVTDDHRSGPDAPGQTVSVRAGGLATSSLTTRRWLHAGQVMHHILDPRTGAPVSGPWRTVSVAATSCVEANVASTAAIVLGDAAVEWLAAQRLPARLVGHDGHVHRLCGWPEDVDQRDQLPGV